jgi:hypothetical protein
MRKRLEERFLEKTIPEPNTGCLLWLGAGVRYGHIWVYGMGVKRAHHVAFFLKWGRWPLSCALHHCDTPFCVNVDHLFEGTQIENMEDMRVKGRASKKPRFSGEDHPEVKLTDAQCAMLRASQLPGVLLARQLGVSTALVSLVRRGLKRALR